mmetsp:Transcript_37041/g.59476  ORF Transcript_37041/g.59476 Transcript_37041/m.59476 type:complete len:245 (+) Transcript_37041:128-862(+)
MIVYTAAGLLISANLMVMISSVNPAMISAAEHRNGDSYLGRRNQVSSHTRCQLQNLRGGALSVRSKRRKRRNSGRWLDPNFQRWYLERQMELQRILERRLYPHLFPPPSKKHPARIAAGLESPDPDPPYWQKYNLELQMQYGSLWYPRQNVSDNIQKPSTVPGERTRREKEQEEFDRKSRVRRCTCTTGLLLLLLLLKPSPHAAQPLLCPPCSTEQLMRGADNSACRVTNLPILADCHRCHHIL